MTRRWTLQLDQVRKELLSRTAEEYRDDAFARQRLVTGLNRLADEARSSPSRMPLNWCSGLANSAGGSSTWPLSKQSHTDKPRVRFKVRGIFIQRSHPIMTTNESELLEAMRRSRLVEINLGTR